MATAFGGFPEAGYEFLRELKENNRREWFQPRKEMYEATVKAPLGELVEALNAEFARFAPEYITEPKRAIYRIYRDVRFSKEKHPYKTNAAAGFHASAVEKESLAGYYVSVSPFEIEIAGRRRRRCSSPVPGRLTGRGRSRCWRSGTGLPRDGRSGRRWWGISGGSGWPGR
jgi:uncharacterized protein (DUF2461 family)